MWSLIPVWCSSLHRDVISFLSLGTCRNVYVFGLLKFHDDGFKNGSLCIPLAFFQSENCIFLQLWGIFICNNSIYNNSFWSSEQLDLFWLILCVFSPFLSFLVSVFLIYILEIFPLLLTASPSLQCVLWQSHFLIWMSLSLFAFLLCFCSKHWVLISLVFCHLDLIKMLPIHSLKVSSFLN